MYGLYTPILLLQAFCIYHAYKNNAEQRWYWFIILFSIFGCGFYLFDHFYNRRNIATVAESVKSIINTNYKIEQLEKELRFNDSIKNKINLAQAYIEIARYQDAQKLYQECLAGFMSDDPDLRMKLLMASYLNQDYSQAIEIGNILEPEKRFRDSEARLAYAWSLHFSQKSDEAERIFKDVDRPFTNYRHRLEYSKALQHQGRKDELRNKLDELLTEFEHMRNEEKRLLRDVIREARDLHASL
jgi:hypothetical protein